MRLRAHSRRQTEQGWARASGSSLCCSPELALSLTLAPGRLAGRQLSVQVRLGREGGKDGKLGPTGFTPPVPPAQLLLDASLGFLLPRLSTRCGAVS